MMKVEMLNGAELEVGEEKLFGTYLNNWKKEKNGENKCEK